jgi:hypothetical protein
MRPTPFELVFGQLAVDRFHELRASLESSRTDAHDLDAFVLDPAVVSLLRELVPDEAGAAVSEHLNLLHHAYLYWSEGGWSFELSRARAEALLDAAPPEPGPHDSPAPRAYYIQFPERLVWAELQPGQPPEPLDGFFVRPWPGGGCFVLGVFGLNPSRDGFSVADVDGHRTEGLLRADGRPLFAPVLDGGEAAGLRSLVGQEEVLELAARTTAVAAEMTHCAGPAHRPNDPIAIT